jgi:hypothetical protein
VIRILELAPIDPDVDEAEHVAHEDWPQGDKRPEIRAVRDFEFQHHDGNEDAMTPSLKASRRFLPIVDSSIFETVY